MIGVGGIGCELLKVLTNSGYRKMTILDLDTIEATNLNRQFYFRKEHVGMSKVYNILKLSSHLLEKKV